jgi:hypothetical protein
LPAMRVLYAADSERMARTTCHGFVKLEWAIRGGRGSGEGKRVRHELREAHFV